MYGIDQNTQETNVASAINAGIQENIKLDFVEFAPLSENGDPIIQVNFKDEFGSTLRELLWEVDTDNVVERLESNPRQHSRTNKELGFTKGEDVTPEDAVKQAFQLFNQRAKHIATKFVTEEAIVDALADVKSYAEFGKAYAEVLNNADDDTAVRLKVILNNKDYSTLPTYPPFIESMSVPAEKSKLEINPKYDRVTKATADQATNDPMSQAGSAGIPNKATF